MGLSSSLTAGSTSQRHPRRPSVAASRWTESRDGAAAAATTAATAADADADGDGFV